MCPRKQPWLSYACADGRLPHPLLSNHVPHVPQSSALSHQSPEPLPFLEADLGCSLLCRHGCLVKTLFLSSKPRSLSIWFAACWVNKPGSVLCFSIFFFLKLINLFLAVLGLRCWSGFSLVVASWVNSSLHCSGLPMAVASLGAEHRL